MVGEIKVSRVAVGLPTPVAIAVGNPVVVVDALVVSLAGISESHVKVLPFAIVATSTWPKLLKDQRPGSRVTIDASTALPQPVKSVALVTTAELLWDVAVVPKASLVAPVNVLVPLPL